MPRGLGWLGVVGPGVIVLGVSIGSGEFLLGPAVFVKYGLTLLWVTLVSVFLQAILNTEVMRYVVATGEPVFTGFMRTRPSAPTWAWIYAGFVFLQVGWPAWAATSAGIIFFLMAGRLAGPEDSAAVYYIGVALFLVCVTLLLIGRRVGRTLELLNWVLIAVILGGFLLLGPDFRSRAYLVGSDGRADWVRPRESELCLHPGRRRLLPHRSVGCVFRLRWRAQHRTRQLGARQGVRHGAARRIHSGGDRWRAHESRASRLQVRYQTPSR